MLQMELNLQKSMSVRFCAKDALGVYSTALKQNRTRRFHPGKFMRRQNATKHPDWVQLTIKLVILVGLALIIPLLLGVTFDILSGSAPLGTLFGMFTGIFVATIIVIRTIQTRYLTIAPVSEEENEEKGEST
jgi:F0F1-type ATP synthase assembly protein I